TMLMDEGMDTGDILLRTELEVMEEDTAGDLHDKMLEPGGRLVVETLRRMIAGKLTPQRQDHAGATYTKTLAKDDGWIDWTPAAIYLDRFVRAMNPWPVAQCVLGEQTVKVWRAVPATGKGQVGMILDVTRDGIAVGTGDGILIVQDVQAPGKKRIAAVEFARGRRLKKGDSFMLASNPAKPK
ncbi:MAG: methionyl-tRNA formyltransferase, partial [Pseudomonadota bacterium]